MKDLNFKKLITSSDVPLYVMELPHANTVAAGVLVKAGTRDEIWPEEAGLAHALEHMVFQGTKNFPDSQKLRAFLEEVGGYYNAFTSKEGTFFYSRVPMEHKDRTAIFLNEVINQPLIPKEKVKIEMSNIAEEIKMWHDDPVRFSLTTTLKFIYGDHPLGKKGLGIKESVLGFDKKDFENWLNKYYGNENFTLLVAGNITAQEAIELLEKNFQDQRKVIQISRKKEDLKDQKERFHQESKQDIQQVQVMLACPTGPAQSKESLALDLYSAMIDGGSSFPLFQEIRDKRGLCYATGTFTERYSDVGFWAIYIGTNPEKYQEAVKVAIDLVQKEKSNQELLGKAKDLILGRLSMEFENPGRIIDSAARDILNGEEPKDYQMIKKEIDSISIKDIESAVKQYLRPEDFRQVILEPKK